MRPYYHRRQGMTEAEYTRQERIRGKLRKMGYKLCRDRVKEFSICHQGQYCVRYRYTDKVALGECYEMSLDDIDMFINLLGFKRVFDAKPAISRRVLRERESRRGLSTTRSE